MHKFWGKEISEQNVTAATQYDREFQPPTQPNNFRTECNKTEVRKERNVLTKLFKP